MKKYRVPARTYELNFTDKCNLACKYCFEKDKGCHNLEANDLRDILQNPLTSSLYLFGGEPMMNAPFHKDVFDIISKSDLPSGLKQDLWRSAASTTTNGTLLDKNLDMIKDLGLRLQVSMDGPKEIHDRNRVNHAGQGSFDSIIKNIRLMKNNDIPCYLHGVVSKNTIGELFEINKFFFEQSLESCGIENAIKSFAINSFMFVIEDDYDDDDIDEAINQYRILMDWLKEQLNEEQYKECLLALASKRGSLCGAGHNTLVLGVKGDIYPCHRGNGQNGEDGGEYTMGNSFSDNPTNIQIYNNYYRNRRRATTTTCLKNPIFWGGDVFTPQVNFCPATYTEVCETLFYVPPKYFIFMMELGNFFMSNAIEAGFTMENISGYLRKSSIDNKKEEEKSGDNN